MMINQEQLKGNWQQIKGEIHKKWGKLTDDDLTECKGNAEQLIGRLTERYGIKKEEAQEKLSQFLNKFDSSNIKDKLLDAAESVSNKGERLFSRCQKFASEKPLATLGIIAAVGALIGMWRSKSSR